MIKNSKKRLFATARHLFAIKGYQETSTRDIADEAKVNISAITYYFGSKLGLYGAVLSDIACRVKKELHEKTEQFRLRTVPPAVRNDSGVIRVLTGPSFRKPRPL